MGCVVTDGGFQCFARHNLMNQPNVVLLSFGEFLLDCLAACIDFDL